MMSRFCLLSIVLAFFAAASYGSQGMSWTYPWEECKYMDQIVGRKCERSYYVCDFGDTWFTNEVLCNNCIGDCPRGKVFDNTTEVCVLPNTIGCDCTREGEILGTVCDTRFYICIFQNGDWETSEKACDPENVFNPTTGSCQPASDVVCTLL